MPLGKVIVAVDGPAGSGKSSVSREAARRLGIRYIDSGAIYRAVTWFLMEKFGPLERGRDYTGGMGGMEITQRFNEDGTCTTSVNGKDVSAKLRSETIARNIGIVSDDRRIRDFVNALLRSWALRQSIIMDGRDIGTVVFPDADLKIYLDASVEVRTARRAGEYAGMGKTVDVNEIKKQIIRRDEEDTSRPYGRLARAAGAVYLDTSSMDKEQVIKTLVELISGACPA
jgi:cytidylate kinase